MASYDAVDTLSLHVLQVQIASASGASRPLKALQCANCSPPLERSGTFSSLTLPHRPFAIFLRSEVSPRRC